MDLLYWKIPSFNISAIDHAAIHVNSMRWKHEIESLVATKTNFVTAERSGEPGV